MRTDDLTIRYEEVAPEKSALRKEAWKKLWDELLRQEPITEPSERTEKKECVWYIRRTDQPKWKSVILQPTLREWTVSGIASDLAKLPDSKSM